MFGYVRIDKPEMKVKEYEAYRGLYCSLCKAMGRYFGVLSRLTLSYDVTFLLLVRLSFLGISPSFEQGRCPFNPTKRCNYCCNGENELKYTASVSMMMFYFKVKDNISDGSFFKSLMMYLLLPWAKSKYKKAKRFYPEVAEIIEECMLRQAGNEKEKTSVTDKAAHESADALGKIVAFGFDDEKGSLHRFGYGIGKWVYLMDAADDIEKDLKTKCYNVFVEKYSLSSFSDVSQSIIDEIIGTLNLSCAIAREAYEKIENKTLVPIIENIIFSGMTIRMNNIFERKN